MVPLCNIEDNVKFRFGGVDNFRDVVFVFVFVGSVVKNFQISTKLVKIENFGIEVHFVEIISLLSGRDMSCMLLGLYFD